MEHRTLKDQHPGVGAVWRNDVRPVGGPPPRRLGGASSITLDNGRYFTPVSTTHKASPKIVVAGPEGRRDEIVLATKVHGQMGEAEHCERLARWIRFEVEQSLRRLSTDCSTTRSTARSDGRSRGDAVGADRSATRGKAIGPDLPGGTDRGRQWVAEQRTRALPLRATALSILARHRAARCSRRERYGMGVIV
jgi:hypothetical protein